jgi:hypothetical protein
MEKHGLVVMYLCSLETRIAIIPDLLRSGLLDSAIQTFPCSMSHPLIHLHFLLCNLNFSEIMALLKGLRA